MIAVSVTEPPGRPSTWSPSKGRAHKETATLGWPAFWDADYNFRPLRLFLFYYILISQW